LSSLEAAYMGCNIVVTKKGDTEEYFEGLVEYCIPDDISSIRAAVMDAYNRPFQPILQNLISSKYRWEDAAHQTFSAYQFVLDKSKQI
jgi:hypothetical protein